MKILNAFLNGYFKQKNAETGRSMVEILGVLAIIGVLSIGGIYGYTFAMDKYRANDIVYEVNLRANDVWHKYQEQPLPDPSEDGTDFDEFPNMTGTGYPIYMTSHPDVAFKTYVEGVSSRVCKNVVNMNLNGIVKGIQFVQVAQGEGDLVKYTGNASICGEDETDNLIVFTSFLDSENNEIGTGQSGDPCVEDMDCSSPCGNATCDTVKMTCKNSCTGTSTPYCLSGDENGICVKCIKREHCIYLGKDYTCSDLTNECVKIPQKCEEKKEFRSKNGICISCTNGSNFMVGLDKFSVPELGIEDTLTGLEQCNACENPTRYSGKVDEETSYCSYACTNKYSFQSVTNGCISCTDKNGYRIAYEDVSLKQCLACQDHIWYQNPAWPNEYICDTDRCKDKESFMQFGYHGNGGNPGVCTSCDTDGCFLVGEWGSANSTGVNSIFRDKCLACGNRILIGAGCCKKCVQPENADEQIAICQANPKDERCTRKWENTSGQCMACSDSGTNTYVGTNAVEGGTDPNGLGALCRACGRTVSEDGYCIYTGGCNEKQFMGIDGICYDCTRNQWVKVKSSDDKDSGCIANCADVTDNQWYKGRRILSSTVKGITSYFCYRKPFDNAETIQDAETGGIYSCSTESAPYTVNPQYIQYGYLIDTLKDECISRCNKTKALRFLNRGDTRCALIDCGTGKFAERTGACVKCSSTGAYLLDWENQNYPTKDSYPDLIKERITACENCGNRIFINEIGLSGIYYPLCVPIVATGSQLRGVCNNINTVLPDSITGTLRENAEKLLNNNTGLYRDKDGYCRSCTDKSSYYTSQSQCDICPNRRYNNNQCIYGLCEERLQFLNIGNSCVSCSGKNIAVNPKKANLCDSCENRRMLTTGFEEQDNWAGLCVEECTGFHWQDINGNCLACSASDDREIGTDVESRRLCNECEGLRESQPIYGGTDGTEITGYRCVLK